MLWTGRWPTRFPKTTYNVTILRDTQHTPAPVPCHRWFRSICRRRSDGRVRRGDRWARTRPPAAQAGGGWAAHASIRVQGGAGAGAGRRGNGNGNLSLKALDGDLERGRGRALYMHLGRAKRAHGYESCTSGPSPDMGGGRPHLVDDFNLPPGNVLCLFSMEIGPF